MDASDTEMTAKERPPLFFAGSDDEEDEDVPMEPPGAPSSSRPSSRASSRLFTDEEDHAAEEPVTPLKRIYVVDDDSDNEVPPPLPPVKSENSGKAGPSRKVSAPASKKRRVSSPTPAEIPPTYIGEMVFGHAWSNVSGKGYIKIGEEVKIMREPREDSKSKAVTKNKKTGEGMKQMSITAMMKQPAKSSRNKKTDNIVRLYNSRGFGMAFQTRPNESHLCRYRIRAASSGCVVVDGKAS